VIIPKRKKQLDDKAKRFYVFAPSSTYLELQKEAFKRDTDLWNLAGSVLTAWLAAGCPDDFIDSPRSSPSSLAEPD